MPTTIKVAEYLFRRLRQLGIDSIHGVPGDFNLTLLDYVEPAGLLWVGNANELNAAYATDGYARIKGIGALITTFGVGELSAINAIAGAYAERAPVVHIVGTPVRSSQDARVLQHHTFNDGEYRRFSQMHAHVTVAQTRLWDAEKCPEQIDWTLQQCLLHSRPVYIEVPVDVVDALVSDERLSSEIRVPVNEPTPTQEAVLAKVLDKLYAAERPIIFVDGEIRAQGIVEHVQEFVTSTKWPTWTTPFGKGLLNETSSNFHGIYRGKYDDPEVQQFINDADLVVCFGPHFSSTNTFAFSSVPKPEVTISFTDTEVNFQSEVIRDMSARAMVPRLLKNLDVSKVKSYDTYPKLPRDYLVSFSDVPSTDPITQDRSWRLLANFLRPGDILLGETGTAGYGAREMSLPPRTRLFTPVTWLSIGYMLPAAQGAALAQRELMAASKYHGIKNARTILLIGDGSFQMTAQELSTIIFNNLNVVVFLINNDGYTIERCIHGATQRYNDVASWRYLQAPSFFGAEEDAYTATAKTWGELENVLGNEKLTDGTGLRMVEVIMDREDAPEGPLSQYLIAQKKKNA
ncbi:thiamine pyrophosphate enzyme [Dactylonectria macrodidyma]|uniref:Pyruvate decarboxylase n=1 Tax=Dactylonectria macrodidyma TaxID=307937 RepID=A0A9P9FGW0_9HYPO|nr:thiamine pyrophosphate enzyme [Dactylonectria macrodidyma]